MTDAYLRWWLSICTGHGFFGRPFCKEDLMFSLSLSVMVGCGVFVYRLYRSRDDDES